jgi:uncharacterized membrane protein
VPVVAFVNQSTGSFFPLFPWAAFVFVGAVLGGLRWLKGSVLVGLAVVVCAIGWCLRPDPFSAISVAFFLERLAWVMVLAAACQWLEHKAKPRMLLFAGRHSLFIYALHLQLISWLSMAGVPRSHFGWGGVAGLFVLVFGVTWGLAVAWACWRARRKAAAGP